MNKKSIESKYTKQIEVLEKLNNCFLEAIPVLEKFDGKIINVKIQRALEEKFKKFDGQIIVKVEHSNRQLTICTWDKTYIVYAPDGSRYSTESVKHYEDHVYLTSDERLNLSLVKNNISNLIKISESMIEDYKTMLSQYEQEMKDYDLLLDKIEEFKHKYDSRLRTDSGCDFRYV